MSDNLTPTLNYGSNITPTQHQPKILHEPNMDPTRITLHYSTNNPYTNIITIYPTNLAST